MFVYFNEDWDAAAPEEAEYVLRIEASDCESTALWKKEIVVAAGEEELFRITVAGQKTEVDEDA